MASFNKVILLGNLTRDPEVRYTPKGSAVCDLGIAVNRVYTTEGGEKREEVTFVDVVLWARLAEIAGEYLKKGRPIFIEGRLQMDTWDDKQTGQKRTKLRVVGESMQLLGRFHFSHVSSLRQRVLRILCACNERKAEGKAIVHAKASRNGTTARLVRIHG